MFQGNHHKYLPLYVGFEAFYGGQPSMLESLGHSKKIPTKPMKGTQIVHYIHVTNVKNLQVESQHHLVCKLGCLCYESHF
jgi:hypothetical protein